MLNCIPTGLSVSKKVLLTGAGFTKDFGGFLANEMWDFIFNSPSLGKYPEIKDILRHDFSYESVYHKVIASSEYEHDEKDAIIQAVESAYDRLDKSIRGYQTRTKSRIANSTSLTAFINRFGGGGNSRSFFFTLNQDLFVERYCRNLKDSHLATPGVVLQGINQNNDLLDNAYQKLPDGDVFEKKFAENNPLRSDRFHYVKLHGSYHWRDSAGNAHMVIGEDKISQIYREPLLKYYFKLFEQVLKWGEVDLFVLGYGFGDEHINNVIADSVRDHNLGLHIMSPEAPEKFMNYLSQKPNCEGLWDSLRAYYPYTISQVFPSDGGAESSTIEYVQIVENFFG